MSSSTSSGSRSSHREHNRIVVFMRFHYIFHRIMHESMNGHIFREETTAINGAQCVVDQKEELLHTAIAIAKIGIFTRIELCLGIFLAHLILNSDCIGNS